MSTRYEHLFSITCLHAFVAERPPVCRSMTLRPSHGCVQHLHNNGLLFRTTPGGGSVWYEQRGTEEPLIQTTREPLHLLFTVHATDPHFINYTDLALDGNALAPSASVYYFTNWLETSSVQSLFGQERTLLHAQPNVTVNDQLPVRPTLFSLPAPENARVEIIDQTGQVVWEGAPIPDEGGRPRSVDLRGAPLGRYRIVIDGQETEAFYLSDIVPSSLWGVVEIIVAPTDLIPQPYRLLEAEGITARSFTIYFENRKTVWRYFIVKQSQNGRDFSDPSVVGSRKTGKPGEERTILFKEVPTHGVSQTIGGRAVLVFETVEGTLIPLSENPFDQHIFTLTAGGQPYMLPYAGADLVKPEQPGNVVSEIYVYL